MGPLEKDLQVLKTVESDEKPITATNHRVNAYIYTYVNVYIYIYMYQESFLSYISSVDEGSINFINNTNI